MEAGERSRDPKLSIIMFCEIPVKESYTTSQLDIRLRTGLTQKPSLLSSNNVRLYTLVGKSDINNGHILVDVQSCAWSFLRINFLECRG